MDCFVIDTIVKINKFKDLFYYEDMSFNLMQTVILLLSANIYIVKKSDIPSIMSN